MYSLTDPTSWIVFIHVASAFVFAAGHGVLVAVAFRLRRETDIGRITALLDISSYSLVTAGIALLVLLVSGIWAGINLGSFDAGWIWLSLVIFVVIGILMTPLGGSYLRSIRQAVGQRAGLKKDAPDPVPVAAEELAAMLVSRKPEALLVVGGGGFFVILWLMMFKPF
jgi:uncharacterized membrane protein